MSANNPSISRSDDKSSSENQQKIQKAPQSQGNESTRQAQQGSTSSQKAR